MNEIQLSQYFHRLGLSHMLSPTLLTLNVLQSAHIAKLPFQNLSTILNEPISLNIKDIFEKVIINQRGGYCYELNLLFAELLQQLGFSVRLLTGKVIPHNQIDQPQARTHMLLEVTCDHLPYLVDVGFGGRIPTIPLLLTSRAPHVTPTGIFRLDEYREHLLLKIQVGSDWRILYQFDLSEQFYPDLEVGNWYVSTHPNSPFRKQLIVTLTTEDGQHHALFNRRYCFYQTYLPAQYQELADAHAVLSTLQECFNLNVEGVNMATLQTFFDQIN